MPYPVASLAVIKTTAPVGNRWYDRVFRVCLYAYWVLAAWNVAFIAQYFAFLRNPAYDGDDSLSLLPAELLYIRFGSKALVFDWGLVVTMLFTVCCYVLLGMLVTLLYQAVRWLLSERRSVRVLSRATRLRAILLALLYWATCWIIYCFSGKVPFEEAEFFYAVVATCGLLAPAAVLLLAALLKAIGWLRQPPAFTTNMAGADVIRRFVAGKDGDWEWDDFLTAPQRNPEVALASALCNHLEQKYPALHKKAFCAAEGLACMLEVADALEQGLLVGGERDEAWWLQLDAHATPGALLPWLQVQARGRGNSEPPMVKAGA